MREKLPMILFAAALIVAVGFASSNATAEESGEWKCYIGDRFPDMEDAAEWHGSRKMAEGLNQTATHAPRGEIVLVPYHSKLGMSPAMGTPLVCIKY